MGQLDAALDVGEPLTVSVVTARCNKVCSAADFLFQVVPLLSSFAVGQAKNLVCAGVEGHKSNLALRRRVGGIFLESVQESIGGGQYGLVPESRGHCGCVSC